MTHSLRRVWPELPTKHLCKLQVIVLQARLRIGCANVCVPSLSQWPHTAPTPYASYFLINNWAALRPKLLVSKLLFPPTVTLVPFIPLGCLARNRLPPYRSVLKEIAAPNCCDKELSTQCPQIPDAVTHSLTELISAQAQSQVFDDCSSPAIGDHMGESEQVADFCFLFTIRFYLC